MEGLYCNIERGEYTKLHLLRFYEQSQYVIYKSVTGSDPVYFKRELQNFKMDGFQVKGEPEYTFCGACQDYGDSISFKVENELTDSSETWVHKDVLSFKGSRNADGSLQFKQVSKGTSHETERSYNQMTEQEILNQL